MSSISRCIGGATRPRELRLISSTRAGHLDRRKLDKSLDSDTPFPEGIPSHLHESDPPQVLQVSFEGPGEVGSEGHVINPSPLDNAEIHLLGNLQPRGTSVSRNHSPSARSASQFSSVPQHTRAFHSSSAVPYESTSYNVTDVPDFFVKFKQYRTISTDLKAHEQPNEDFGLMQSLSESVLSGDIVASTRRLKAKIPVEHHATGGRIIHPSGFVVPGPGHISTSAVARAKEMERNEKKDRAAQTAAVAHRVLESSIEQVDATTFTPLHKIPFEIREPDGTVRHPSGFVPPTPAHNFRYTVNRIRQPSRPRAVLRAMHTISAPRGSGGV